MKQEQERVRNMLLSAVSMLCKNSLHFNVELKIEGLLGITLDNDEVFLVHVNDRISCSPSGNDAPIAKSVTANWRKRSHNHNNSNSIQQQSKSPLLQQKHSVVEIAPETSAQIDNDQDASFTASDEESPELETEPGIVSETPATPRKRKRRRGSKSGAENSTNQSEFLTREEEQGDSTASSSIVIKPEPEDEQDNDLLVVSAVEGRTRMYEKQPDSNFCEEATSSFVGFGDYSESDSLGMRGGSSTPDTGSALSSGLVSNALTSSDSEQNMLWDNAGSLVPGLPAEARTSLQSTLDSEWTSTSASRKIPTAAASSAAESRRQSADMVSTISVNFLLQMQAQLMELLSEFRDSTEFFIKFLIQHTNDMMFTKMQEVVCLIETDLHLYILFSLRNSG